MHKNETTTREAKAKNYVAENKVKAVKFGLEADPAWRRVSLEDLTSLTIIIIPFGTQPKLD